jgi:hypothetical protein
MITKEIILSKCKEAKNFKSFLYLIAIDNKFKFMFSNEPSWIFLKENNLNDSNLVQGLNPDTVLKYDNCNDMSVSTLVDMINKEYAGITC